MRNVGKCAERFGKYGHSIQTLSYKWKLSNTFTKPFYFIVLNDYIKVYKKTFLVVHFNRFLHSSKTTGIYTHVATTSFKKIKNPLDF
ncbi:hypothetical protein DHD32_18380 [Arenibacter sp. TNZ]|nr:hypothetical protein [Arenibacter sp. TNZ]